MRRCGDAMTKAGQQARLVDANAGTPSFAVVASTTGAALHPPPALGRRSGRRPKLSGDQQAAIAAAVLSGQHTAAEMARRYRVSEPTVSRILAARRANAQAAGGGEAPDASEATLEWVVGVLPVAVLEERLAIVGTAGSGKTYAAKGMVERLMAAGARVCIVDPLGVWWGLRLDADATTPASVRVVVFGGRHADVPLTPSMGAALGRLVGTQALACVVDVSDLGSGAARRGFMTAFTEALYDSNTEPLHLVLDEADLWAPQRVQLDGYDLLGRIEEIVRRGRVRGFVPWLITQRPAVLHKDVLSQADILVSMKLTSSQDRAAIGRWIEGQADRIEGRRILAACPDWGAAKAGSGRHPTACSRTWRFRASRPSTARARPGVTNGSTGQDQGHRWTCQLSSQPWPPTRRRTMDLPASGAGSLWSLKCVCGNENRSWPRLWTGLPAWRPHIRRRSASCLKCQGWD